MYVIFIHITGIALIEILFYFLYIGKMETKMFMKNINHLLKSEEGQINYNMYNTSLLPNDSSVLEYYQLRANNGEKDRNNQNNLLLKNAIIGFVVILSITLIAIILEHNIMNKKITRIRSMDSVRNVCLELTEYTPTVNNQSQDTSNEETPRDNEYKIIIYFGHAVVYTILLITFEYWFFNFIIVKYKVISNEEIEYLFAKNLEEKI